MPSRRWRDCREVRIGKAGATTPLNLDEKIIPFFFPFGHQRDFALNPAYPRYHSQKIDVGQDC